jgi:dTDP-4-amino-4,6-dideoxygalactose transaminase
VHQQQLYRDLGYGDQRFPVSERAAREVLSLPIHPGLTRNDLDTIVAAVEALKP